MPPTTKEIARRCGVSPTTVSYVLNGRADEMKIRGATASRILRQAKQLKYRSNFLARSLARKRTGVIGLIYPDLAGSAADEITRGVEEVLGPAGYRSMIAASFWDKRREEEEVGVMLDTRVEGILALPLVGGEAAYESAIAAECPLAFIGDWLEDVRAPSVAFDGAHAVEQIVDHLVQTGRRSIYMLAVDWDSACLRQRERAFIAALEKHRLPSIGRIRYTSVGDHNSITEGVQRFVAQVSDSDALLCISDTIALIAMAELARLGVQVPRQLAVAGLGNLELSSYPMLSITTVDERRRDIGRVAARLLVDIIENRASASASEPVRLRGDLIIRRSTSRSEDA